MNSGVGQEPPGQSRGGPGAKEAWSYAWACAKKDFPGVVLPPAFSLFVTMLLTIGLNFGVVILVKGAVALKAGLLSAMAAGAAVQAILAIPSSAAAAFCIVGITRFAARLVRGDKTGFADVFQGAAAFGPALVTTIVTMTVPAVVSSLLRAVPLLGWLGTLVAFAGGIVAPWAFAAAEGGRQGMAAVNEGWSQVRASVGTALGLMLFGGLGVLACCFGMFVTMPLMFIALAYVYRRRTGGPVA